MANQTKAQIEKWKEGLLKGLKVDPETKQSSFADEAWELAYQNYLAQQQEASLLPRVSTAPESIENYKKGSQAQIETAKEYQALNLDLEQERLNRGFGQAYSDRRINENRQNKQQDTQAFLDMQAPIMALENKIQDDRARVMLPALMSHQAKQQEALLAHDTAGRNMDNIDRMLGRVLQGIVLFS